jgi:hypothetical protein
MGVNGYRVIDADGHGGELPDWQARIPTALADKLAAWKARCTEHYARLAIPGGGLARSGDRYDHRSSVTRAEVRDGMFDPAARLADMDLEGIDVTVNFTGGAGEEWALLDRELATAVCRALNDAKAGFNRHAPERFKGVAIVPMIDPEAAAAELRRAVTELGLVALVTRQHVREKNLDDPSFDVLWAEAERLGVPVCLHGGGQAPDQVPIAVDRFHSRLTVHALTHPLGNMIGVIVLHRRRHPAPIPEAARCLHGVGLRLVTVLARAPRRALGAHAGAGARHQPPAERVLPRRPLLHRLRPRRAHAGRDRAAARRPAHRLRLRLLPLGLPLPRLRPPDRRPR